MRNFDRESVFIVSTSTLALAVVFAVFNIVWVYIASNEKNAIEAVKAGLVQQDTHSSYTIWVKPEDYKTYPISTFDAPRWER